MISKAKLPTTPSPRRAVCYMMNKAGFEVVHSTMFANDKEGIIKEFEERMATNTRGKHKLLHVIHSLHKDDKVGLEAWKEYCQETAELYGADMSFAGFHVDTDEIHCHQIICLVKTNGKMCDRTDDHEKLRKQALRFEKKYGTTKTRDRAEDKKLLEQGIDPKEKQLVLTKEEIEKQNRLFKEDKVDTPVPPRMQMEAEIEEILYRARDWDEFKLFCGKVGISCQSYEKDGKVTGVTWKMGETILKGGNSRFTVQKLQKIFNHYTYSAKTDVYDGTPFNRYQRPTTEQKAMIATIDKVARESKDMNEFEYGLYDAEVKFHWVYDREGRRQKIVYGRTGPDDNSPEAKAEGMTGTMCGYNIQQLQRKFKDNEHNTSTKGDGRNTNNVSATGAEAPSTLGRNGKANAGAGGKGDGRKPRFSEIYTDDNGRPVVRFTGEARSTVTRPLKRYVRGLGEGTQRPDRKPRTFTPKTEWKGRSEWQGRAVKIRSSLTKFARVTLKIGEKLLKQINKPSPSVWDRSTSKPNWSKLGKSTYKGSSKGKGWNI